MAFTVDLSADVGESGGQLDALLVPMLTSVSIACGVHAGDAETMRRSVALADRYGVAVGAHPGFADRRGFGRREVLMSPLDAERLVATQVGALTEIAAAGRVRLRHVKVHGALYTMAARDPDLAGAVVRAVASIDRRLILFAPSRSCMARAALREGLPLACEAFADRNYEPDGTLTPRSQPGAVLTDAKAVARRGVTMVQTGVVVEARGGSRVALDVDTLCVHSDTLGAVAVAERLRAALVEAGVELAAPAGRRDA